MAEPTCLYVITDDAGACKVGVSRSPQRRLRQLQTGASRRLRIARAGAEPVALAREVEAYAHWLLRAAQMQGEWFQVTEEAAWVALVASCIAVAKGERAPRRIAGSGRPSLNVEETKVRLTAGAKERIAALVGTYGMAGFIRRAVDAAIDAAEAEKRKPSKGATGGSGE